MKNLAERLATAGYRPIPLNGKVPIGAGWTDKRYAFHEFTDERNIGILTGEVIALDCDIDDRGINDALADWVAIEFGEVPMRYRANSARRMFLFLSSDPEFLKITRDFEQGRIEVLGHGQQFMAFGTHPSGAELQWMHWCEARQLPVISREQLGDFISRFATEQGLKYEQREARPAQKLDSPREWVSKTNEGFDDVPETVIRMLERLDADDYSTWISAGMALKAEAEDTWGYKCWVQWSQQSAKFPGEKACERRWRGFGASRTSIDSLARSAGVGIYQDDFEVYPDWVPPPPKAAAPPIEAIDGATGKKKYLSLRDWAGKKPPRWRIKGIIPENGLFEILAAPNVGKTFLALDMLECVTAARPWFGHKTKPTENPLAVFFAYEGSLVVRARGLHAKYGRDAGSRVIGLPGNIKLGDSASIDKCIEMLKAIEEAEAGTINMVLFDTLNLALMGANENSSEDMGAALDGLKRLQRAFRQAAVGVVHHLGKDATKGGRGHSSLLGGVDTVILVTEDSASGMRYVALTKSRDGDRTGQLAAFVLQVCNVGMDEDGDPITSCYVLEKDVSLVKVDKETAARERALAAIAPEGSAQAELIEALGMRKEDALELFERMESEGLIEIRKGAKGRKTVHKPGDPAVPSD